LKEAARDCGGRGAMEIELHDRILKQRCEYWIEHRYRYWQGASKYDPVADLDTFIRDLTREFDKFRVQLRPKLGILLLDLRNGNQ